MFTNKQTATDNLRSLAENELDHVTGGMKDAPVVATYGPAIGDWVFKDVFSKPVLGRYTPR
jgi:hypothetical protein